MGKKQFIATVFDPESKIFVVQIAYLNSVMLNNTDINLFYSFQIANFITKKVLTKIFAKYVKFVNMVSLDLAFKLSKYTKINDYAMELIDS